MLKKMGYNHWGGRSYRIENGETIQVDKMCDITYFDLLKHYDINPENTILKNNRLLFEQQHVWLGNPKEGAVLSLYKTFLGMILDTSDPLNVRTLKMPNKPQSNTRFPLRNGNILILTEFDRKMEGNPVKFVISMEIHDKNDTFISRWSGWTAYWRGHGFDHDEDINDDEDNNNNEKESKEK